MTRRLLLPFLPVFLLLTALIGVAFSWTGSLGADLASGVDSSILLNQIGSLKALLGGLGLVTVSALLIAIFLAKSVCSKTLETLQEAVAVTREGQPAQAPNTACAHDKIEDIKSVVNDIIEELNKRSQRSSELERRLSTTAQKLARAEQRTEDVRLNGESSRQQGLKNAASTLGGAIQDIHSSSGDVSAASSRSAQGAQDQSRLTSEAATAMEQMNASVAEVAAGAESAASAANEARARAEEGANAVDDTVHVITSVHERTASLGKIVAGLGEQAEDIGRIIGVINDIADQTNLLALNAAIEAARAGDAGRGFAVVADEVRKLAEKTMDATKEVGAAIGSIQDGVGKTSEGMKDAESLVDNATSAARRSGDMLAGIVQVVGDSSERIGSIAAAATQQSAACEQVTRTIAMVEDISSNTLEAMDNSRQAVDSLIQRLGELDSLHDVFELMGTGNVQRAINQLAESAEIASMDPDRQEQALRDSMRANTFLELLYMTDARGIQPVANIPRPGKDSASDQNARGQDWSSRPWFTGAMEVGALYISDVYVSQASGERCITVSSPFRDGEDAIQGVIAADVTLG